MREGPVLKYLKKENLDLAESLALKKYYTLQLEDLNHERIAMEMYMHHHLLNVNKSSKLLADTSGYRPLLASHFLPMTEELQNWVNSSYQRDLKYPEQLIHKSISGNILRSKSEVLIDMALYQNHIPYRYESALTLDGITIYPDFILRHPITGQLFYWEHFGMMDNLNYVKTVLGKLQLYITNGIIPSIHLITTYETKETPLTSIMVQQIIDQYFL